jgi:sugar O-acyltransferase (sialic acid O-acetyltransferase NeuD family)
LLGFIDDNRSRGKFCGTEVLGGLDAVAEIASRSANSLHYITAVGSNSVRRQLVERIDGLKLKNLTPWTLQHPAAHVGRDVTTGEGTCLTPGSVLTTRIRVGKHCIVNVNASISHDCVIGDFANINPGATLCGNVTIGDGVFVGAGGTIKEKISIGRNAVIGAGSVVLRDVPASVTAVGVPAKVIES